MPAPRIALLVVLVLIGGGIAYGLFGHPKNDAAKNASLPVNVAVAAVTARDMPRAINVAGNVIANQSVAIKSRIDSQIMEVRFKDGDEVKQGDVLFVLDPRVLQAQVDQLQSNLVAAKATTEDLRLKYARAKDLRAKGYETAANYDTARSSYEAGLANIKNTEAALNAAKVQLDYTVITSPINGRAGTINLTLGNNVKANDAQPLVTINEITPIAARAAIPQASLTGLRDAMTNGTLGVQAVISPGAKPIDGTLSYIDNQIDATTGTVVVRALFPNTDEKLWPGMFVNLVIVTGVDKDALTVPETAIQHGQNGEYVFVAENGHASKKDVQVSRVQDGQAVIATGLALNQQVVVDGTLTLKDGAAVNIQPAGKADSDNLAAGNAP